MTSFLTLDDINVTHKNVIVRVDFNLPMKNGAVNDKTRLYRSFPTLKELKERQARLILMSHFGRPNGKIAPEASLKPICDILSQELGEEILFIPDIMDPRAHEESRSIPYGSIAFLENLRFYPGEETNDPIFSQHLARFGDLYVNEAFSCSHRAHASVVGITDYIPSVAGRGTQQELNALSSALFCPHRPFAAIVAGSKVSTKLDLLENLCKKVDYLIIGGAMANTFLAAEGYPIGQSLYEANMLSTASVILKRAKEIGCQVILPLDVLVSTSLTPPQHVRTVETRDVGEADIIGDIGPQSIGQIKDIIVQCQTIVWNGPVGVFEIPPFDQASLAIAHMIAERTCSQKLYSYAGGGDTIAALAAANCLNELTYVSTAGGAFLEWLEGKTLPGIEALEKNMVLETL